MRIGNQQHVSMDSYVLSNPNHGVRIRQDKQILRGDKMDKYQKDAIAKTKEILCEIKTKTSLGDRVKDYLFNDITNDITYTDFTGYMSNEDIEAWIKDTLNRYIKEINEMAVIK